MIGPVTVLSLAAVSAAEATVYGERFLPRQKTSTTPIIVVSGTAVLSFIAGFGVRWLTASTGSSGKEILHNATGIANYDLRATGCKVGFYQDNAPEEGLPTCKECPEGTRQSGTHFFGSQQTADVCNKCVEGSIPTKVKSCEECGQGMKPNVASLYDIAKDDAGKKEKAQECKADVPATGGN